MAVNYKLMLNSEKELLVNFCSYFSLAITQHEELVKTLLSKKPDFNNLYLKIKRNENKIDDIYADMLDACMWDIQKNQPKADHLRFVIAIINGIRDVEKISDYAEKISKFFEKKIIKDELIKTITDLYCSTVQTIKLFNPKLLNYSWENLYFEFHEKMTEIHQNFKKILKGVIFNLSENISSDSDSNKNVIDFIGVIKYIERTCDHVDNIFEAFSYVCLEK